jgi:uncharacterized protein YwgA
MNAASEMRYRRIGVVVGIIEKMNERTQPGKTTLQKLVYLSQVLYKIPLEYRFEPYNYGPYSKELTTDMENLEYRGLLNVDFDNEGFHIRKGDVQVPARALSQDETYSSQISELVDNWGNIQAKDLELYATFIYVDRMYHQKGETLTKGDIIEIVKEIKPGQEDRFEDAIEFLTNRDVFLCKLD